MTSPNDNMALKDALSVQFKMRAKDVSLAQDGSLQYVRHLATPYPVDYGTGGCYHHAAKSGIMAAGLAAGAPIFAFRNPSPSLLALLHRIRLCLYTDSVGFTAGVGTFDLYRAVSFTVQDTGGAAVTLSGNETKLRSAMAGPSIVMQRSTTAALTPGTRTLDAAPIDSVLCQATASANTLFVHKVNLFEQLSGEHPLALAQNEGFVIQATVPATGTWRWEIMLEWSEVLATGY